MSNTEPSERCPPTVSIIMPVRNAATYVGEAIDGVLCQTFADFELLVVGDGADDDTAAVVQDRTEQDARVHLSRGPAQGLGQALNRGLAQARGSLIGRFDADDLCHSDWLARQIEFLQQHPDCVAVGAQPLLIDERGRPIGLQPRPLSHVDIENYHLGGRGGGVLHSALLIRRTAIAQIGGYHPDTVPAEDLDLMLRLAEVGMLANLADVLLAYRRHPGSLGLSQRLLQERQVRMIISKARARRGLEPLAESQWPKAQSSEELQLRLMRLAFRSQNYETAWHLALSSLSQVSAAREVMMVLGRAGKQLLLGRGNAMGRYFSFYQPSPGPGHEGAQPAYPIRRADAHQPAILLYNPSCAGQEADLWPALHAALKRRGFALHIAGSHAPTAEVPYVYLPYGLGGVRATALPWASVKHWPLAIEELLQREALWAGRRGNIIKQAEALHTFATLHAALLSSLRPRLVLLWNGEQTQELVLRQMLSWCACPAAFVERAPFPDLIMLDREGTLGASSFVRAAGQASEQASHQTTEEARWLSSFDTLCERLQSAETTWWEQPRARSLAVWRRELAIPDGFKVVLFAGQLDRDTQNLLYSPHFRDGLDAFAVFCRWMKKRADVFVLGKHHPKSDRPVSAFEQWVSGVGAWRSDISLEDCLQLADAVAAVNSSVLFEAAARGKPCLAMGTTLFAGRGAFCELSRRDDEQTVERWLAMRSAEARSAWRQAGARALAQTLFACKPTPELRGPEEMAEQLIRWAEPSEPNYAAVADAGPAVLRLFAALSRAPERGPHPLRRVLLDGVVSVSRLRWPGLRGRKS